jgi:uncharacterized membrane protein YidH (DUF202 family)
MVKQDLHSKKPQAEKILLGEVQLILAEKRTYFSLLRTGIAIFTFPLTIIAFLAATSQHHDFFARVPIAVTIISILSIVSLLGLVLFFQAEARVKHLNRLILGIKAKNRRLAEIIL